MKTSIFRKILALLYLSLMMFATSLITLLLCRFLIIEENTFSLDVIIRMAYLSLILGLIGGVGLWVMYHFNLHK